MATQPGGFHVTDRESARDIVRRGFQPDWGDVGYGVYLWGTLASARAYAKKGGWRGTLKEPVILLVEHPDIRPLYSDEIHPEWPNPEDYEDVYFWEADEESEEPLIPTRATILP